MRHKFLVLTVKKLLKSVYIYGSYRKIKTGVSLFLDHPAWQSRTAPHQLKWTHWLHFSDFRSSSSS